MLRHAAGLIAKQVAVLGLEFGLGDRIAADVQAGDAGVSLPQRVQGNLGLQRYMEYGAHAGAHHFRIERIHAAGAKEAPEATEPGQRAQDGAQIAGILHLVKVKRFFPGGVFSAGSRWQWHQRQDALRRSGIGKLGHLPVTDDVLGPEAGPVLVGAGHIQLGVAPVGHLLRRFFQLQYQMLAFHQKLSERLAVFLLMQLFDVVQFHGLLSMVPGTAGAGR